MLISVCYSNPVCQLSQVESSANYGYLTDYYYNAGSGMNFGYVTVNSNVLIVSQIKQITYCIFDNN